jgi:hypothetical protein
MQLIQPYVQKSRITIFPRRSRMVSGRVVFSQSSPGGKSGACAGRIAKICRGTGILRVVSEHTMLRVEHHQGNWCSRADPGLLTRWLVLSTMYALAGEPAASYVPVSPIYGVEA